MDLKAKARQLAMLSGVGTVVLLGQALARDDDESLLRPNTLIISSSKYDPTQGAVASLKVGSTLPGSTTATTQAISDNNYVTVWNNNSVDGSFGVTSPIRLSAVDPETGRVLRSIRVPSDQVVTSFPSKSELGLHLTGAGDDLRLTFMAYAGPGIGALDASNSDAVAGQDPTNPVTFAFGSSYAFHRTIVSMDREGRFAYTPTVDYGGNNGRSALFASNGLYYAVGNANNGTASTYGPNGTTPNVTETTGLNVVRPVDAGWAASKTAQSAEVDPMIQYPLGKNGALDKAGKDNNYRGLTEYQGALYFTKGSGSNGMDTVYTVSSLPTLANAGSRKITVVPGFPTDSARSTGGNYTPFAVFFANPTTLYVTDEGSGSSVDATQHAGLQKWSLVAGVWKLDYVLTQGLIGTVETALFGYDGQYPDVTTSGLRNLTGVINENGTVTLWATTSTTSASADNGADPNKVVRIVDQLDATTVTGQVATETFVTLTGPTYGTVYRGVAYAPGGCERHGREDHDCEDRHSHR